jgi:SPP1 gp7 family putative phage head morphogenesis protein
MKRMANYFEVRAAARLTQSEQKAKRTISMVKSLYERALQTIEFDLRDLYERYSDKAGIPRDILREVLKGSERAKVLKDLRALVKKQGLKFSDVYDRGFISRIDRLQALKEKAYWQVMAIAKQEQDVTRKTYSEIIRDSYRGAVSDRGSFSEIDSRVVDEILSSDWEGGNYSDRVWSNVSRLSREMPKIIGSGMMIGRSYAKIANDLRERFDVSKSVATRLVRTEANFMHNGAELQSYYDDKIVWYQYTAYLDSRTSTICRTLNGRAFRVDDARVGENYPPMHPNCRSTTIAVIGQDEEADAAMVGVRESMDFLELDSVALTPKEQREIIDKDISLSALPVPARKKGLNAQYNVESRKIEMTTSGKNRDTASRRTTFFHELGHAIDYPAGYTKGMRCTYSGSRRFQRMVREHPQEVASLYQAILERGFDRKLSSEQVSSLLSGGTVKKYRNEYVLPKGYLEYLTRPDEIFANIYGVCRGRPDEFADSLPNFFQYMNEISKN